MNLGNIKNTLSSGEVTANQVNPIIDSLDTDGLSELSTEEKKALGEMIRSMLLLIQDPTSGAHLNNPEKAELLLAEIDSTTI